MVTVFDKGDKEYFEWMNKNPNGFIMNTGKGKDTSYFFLHKSNCFHITEYSGFDEKAYTMKGLIKIASNEVSELIQYCQSNKNKFKGEIRICKTCQPESFKNEIFYPDDLSKDEEKYTEGAKKVVIVNAYERNLKARKKCIEHYGCQCLCCGLKFEEKYGEIGEGFIHVHHIKLLSEVGDEYKVDPIKDLIPLCPNCHAMIHKRKLPFSLDELKEKMK